MHTSRFIFSVSALFLLAFATSVFAQTETPAKTTPTAVTAHHEHHNKKNAENMSGSCGRIVEECKKLGFIVGQWKKDNGLWKDCFDPVVKGGTPTREGHPINVPVSENEVRECKESRRHIKAEKKEEHTK